MGDLGSGGALANTQLPGNIVLPSTDQEEISVLVTGFGPFKSNLVNASYLIASSLPTSLPYSSKSYTSTSPNNSVSAPRRISIHVHPSPISVAYSAVRTSIPAIMEEYANTHGGRNPDIVIHMGIAATRSYYSVEMQAHRDAYHMSDNLGRAGYEDGERPWRNLELPPVLKPGRVGDDPAALAPRPSAALARPASSMSQEARTRINAQPPDEALLSAWRALTPSRADVRISEDAGRYLCEFIFYTSLALAFREQRDRNVIFLHVPGSCTDEDIETGTEVAIALIKALVMCWVDEKV